MKTNLIFFFCLAIYALIPLKLFGVIKWPWWTVLLPPTVVTLIIVVGSILILKLMEP